MSELIALNIVGDSYLERLTCLAAVLLTMYDANPSIDLTSPFSNSLPISTKQVCSKDVKSGILCQIVFPILSTISTTFGYRTAFSMNIKFSFLSIYFPPHFPLTIEGDKTLCFWDILLKKYFRPSSWILLYYLFVEKQLLFS